jgi:predicted amidophosphoribosyltransferase
VRLVRVLAALLDLVLPQPCAGCGAATAWCAACDRLLAAAAASPCGLTHPDPVPTGFPLTAAAAGYDGAVRGALLAHKERGRLALSRPLGAALAAAVRCLEPPPGVLLVPMPSSRAAVRQRGHDHARRLAREAAASLVRQGIPAGVAELLVVGRRVRDQAGLGAAGRAANLAGALRVASGVRPGATVVVVDDVVTTGASLTEATRALTSAGLVVHGAATVAATRRRPRDRGAPGSVH